MAKGGPDLKRYMDKTLSLKLNGNRTIKGVLRGYDPFMNLVLDDATDMGSPGEKRMGMIIVRGNSVIQFEILDPLRF
ncbi:unnamed protein product [Discosporangium mesarthrocarpum]